MSFHGFLTNSLTNDFSSCRKMTQRCSGWLGNTIASKLGSQRLNCFAERICSAFLLPSWHWALLNSLCTDCRISLAAVPTCLLKTSTKAPRSLWEELRAVQQLSLCCDVPIPGLAADQMLICWWCCWSIWGDELSNPWVVGLVLDCKSSAVGLNELRGCRGCCRVCSCAALAPGKVLCSSRLWWFLCQEEGRKGCI